MELLTDSDIAVLNAARSILKDVHERCWSEAREASQLDAMSLGELRQSADTAENQVFGVLNHANASGFVTMTEAQLHNREQVSA